MKLEGVHTETSTVYLVKFNNKAAHRCKTMQEAVDFGKTMGGTSRYGKPTEVYKITTTVSKTFELVQRFGVVADEYEETRDLEGFDI